MTSNVTRLDIEVPSADGPVRARLYQPATPTRALVWAHGGGFVWGDLDMPEADWVATWFAEHGYEVLSVDYRLAAEPDFEALRIGSGGHPFPAAHHDVVACFDWMVAHVRQLSLDPASVVLGGASAGANLAAGAAVALRDRAGDAPGALFLAYPVLHAELPAAGPEAAAALTKIDPDRRFPPALTRLMNLNYVGGDAALLADPRAFAGEGDVAGLPPTIIVNSEADDLRSSGEKFARQLFAAGVHVSVSVEPDTLHGHLNEPSKTQAALTLASVDTWLESNTTTSTPSTSALF